MFWNIHRHDDDDKPGGPQVQLLREQIRLLELIVALLCDLSNRGDEYGSDACCEPDEQ